MRHYCRFFLQPEVIFASDKSFIWDVPSSSYALLRARVTLCMNTLSCKAFASSLTLSCSEKITMEGLEGLDISLLTVCSTYRLIQSFAPLFCRRLSIVRGENAELARQFCHSSTRNGPELPQGCVHLLMQHKYLAKKIPTELLQLWRLGHVMQNRACRICRGWA